MSDDRKAMSAAEIFNRDVEQFGAYVYADPTRLSSRLATDHWLEMMLDLGPLAGRQVLDLGCGDGSFTMRYAEAGAPERMLGIDSADHAVAAARQRRRGPSLDFLVGDGHRLPFADDSFDVIIIQAVLHHDDDPPATLREAFRVAREIFVLEPNGYSPILKILEKVMPYHRAHKERSYTARQLRRWVWEAGGETEVERFGGLVPMFCPDLMARALKRVEPAFEAMPGINRIACADYVFRARRRTS